MAPRGPTTNPKSGAAPPPGEPPDGGVINGQPAPIDSLAEPVDLKDARRARQRAARQKAALDAAGSGPPAHLPAAAVLDESLFRAIGYNRDHFFFMDRRSGQLKSFRARDLRDVGNLFSLAQKDYWEANFANKRGIDKDSAADALMRACYTAGFFTPDNIRGRGAWWDEGRCVLHVGSHLVVEGKRESILDFESDFIYERGQSFGLKSAEPLGVSACVQFLDLCNRLPWERGYMGSVFAGWCVVAAVTGAMAWRPHIYVAGESGSGKTVLQKHMLSRILGTLPLFVSSKTTEPGIRGALGKDARPVIFEEAEGERAQDRDRLQHIYDVARVASSEDSPPILKGRRNGEGGVESYMIRASFCMFGILPTFTSQADQSRFFILELIKPKSLSVQARKAMQKRFELLVKDCAVVLTDDFPARLLGRAIRNIKVVRANAATFSGVAAVRFHDTRFGDQLGAFLAGRALLDHNRILTIDEAMAAMTKYGFPEGLSFSDEPVEDQAELLNTIRQTETELLLGSTRFRRNFGNLMEVAAGFDDDPNQITRAQVNEHLLNYGIKVLRDDFDPNASWIWFANSHSRLKDLLRNTKWAANWGRTLRRLPGAMPSGKLKVRFGSSGNLRANGIPARLLMGDEEEAPRPPVASSDNPMPEDEPAEA